MKRRTVVQGLGLAGVGGLFTPGFASTNPATRAPETGVYELRVYTTYEGKLGDLLKRFREHTTAIFERHGMKNVAYWTPMDEPASSSQGSQIQTLKPASKTLIYILKHPSREAAAANWKAFQDDPEWQQVRAKSEEAGKIVEKVDSTFMVLTDFSPKVG